MPDIKRVADEPEPDHHPVREKVTVEESILPGRNHQDCAHHWEKRLVTREVLIIECKYGSQDEGKTDYGENVPAEPHTVRL